MANNKELVEIHSALTNRCKSILNQDKVTASQLNVIRQFLKDNNIECDGTKNEKMQSIYENLPFDNSVTTTVSRNNSN